MMTISVCDLFDVDVFVLIVAIVILIPALSYWYFTRTFNYWRDKGVCFLEPKIIYGNMKPRYLQRQSVHEFIQDLYNKLDGHGFGGFFEGRRPALLVRDPELIKNIFVKDFQYFTDRNIMEFPQVKAVKYMLPMLCGSQWKAIRQMTTPAFTSRRIKDMESLMKECGTEMGEYIRRQLIEKADNEFNVTDLFGRFVLDVITKHALGVSSESFKDPDAKMVKVAESISEISSVTLGLMFFILLMCPKIASCISLPFFKNEAVSLFVNIARESKRKREANETARQDDFIQLMLDAAQKELKIDDPTKRILDEDTICAQALIFIMAGFETTNNVLTFACYELALNPDIQSKLRQEILTVLDKHHDINYETTQEMPYLEMFILETLRVHPPVSRIDRVCTKDYVIPGTSVMIEKGCLVSVSVAGLHYDPEFYPEPERFDPERFSKEGKATRSPYSFLPFGSGPRNCVGLRLAMNTAKTALIYLLKEFKLEISARTTVPYKHNKYAFSHRAEGGIWLDIKMKREVALNF